MVGRHAGPRQTGTGWYAGFFFRQTAKQTDWHSGKQAGRQTYTQTDKPLNRDAGILACRLTGPKGLTLVKNFFGTLFHVEGPQHHNAPMSATQCHELLTLHIPYCHHDSSACSLERGGRLLWVGIYWRVLDVCVPHSGIAYCLFTCMFVYGVLMAWSALSSCWSSNGLRLSPSPSCWSWCELNYRLSRVSRLCVRISLVLQKLFWNDRSREVSVSIHQITGKPIIHIIINYCGKKGGKCLNVRIIGSDYQSKEATLLRWSIWCVLLVL